MAFSEGSSWMDQGLSYSDVINNSIGGTVPNAQVYADQRGYGTP